MSPDHQQPAPSSDPGARPIVRDAYADVEASYQRLLRIVPDAVAIYDIRRERSIWVGAAITAILGYTPGEIRDLQSGVLQQVIHPDDRPGLQAFFAAFGSADGDEVREHEFRGLHKDGTVLWLRSRATPFSTDDEGRVQEVLVVTRDITGHEHTRARLQASQARLRLTLEAAQLGTWHYDAERDLTTMDEQCRAILGLPPHSNGTASESTKSDSTKSDSTKSDDTAPPSPPGRRRPARGMPPGQEHTYPPAAVEHVIHPDDRARMQAASARSLDPADDDDNFFEMHRVVRLDGQVRWVRGTGRAFFDGTGPNRTPVSAMGVVVDVTKEKRQQERLDRVRNRLAIATESARLGWGTLNVDTGRMEWDARGQTIIGLTEQDAPFTKDNWFACIHPDDRATVDAHLRACIESGEDFDYTYRVVRADGTLRFVRGTGTFYRATPEGPLLATGLVQDVTDQRRAADDLKALTQSLEARVRQRTEQVRALSKQLALAEQEERRRLGEVLHEDLQQRLFALQMHLSSTQHLHQQQPDPQPDVASALEETMQWVHEAIAVTRNLSHDLQFTAHDGTFADALNGLGDQFKRRYSLHVWIAYHIEATHPFDPYVQILVVRCIQGLLLNVAKHAGTDEAYVTVAPDPAQDGQFFIAVEDHGRGFRPERTETADDAGLGLRDLRQRIALVDGHVRIDAAPGRGTRVALHFPLP